MENTLGEAPLELPSLTPPVPKFEQVKVALDSVQLSELPIASTQLLLPPLGMAVHGDQLPIMGTTQKGAKVFIASQEVSVDADGRFAGVAKLPLGESTLSVRVRDELGNEAVFERQVEREAAGLFILGVADTAIGLGGAKLDGVLPQTSLQLGPAWVHGRVAAWVQGEWEFKKGPFKEVGLKLHLDTARLAEEGFVRELIDPNRGYLTFGDSGEEETLAESYGPLFAELEFDKNQLSFGNVASSLGNGGLFDYRRAIYGLKLEIDETLAEHWRTETEGFVSMGDIGQMPSHALLQGTGGSLYFLPDRDLVEGSERLRLVVRDRESGMILGTRALSRNVDYTIRASQGQVLLKRPLPSVANAAWLGGVVASASPLDDHPVFLEADYNTYVEPGRGRSGGGFYFKEHYGELFSFGGGLVAQGKGESARPYQLYGLFAQLGKSATTYLKLEVSKSLGSDISGLYSADGGLSYSALIPQCQGAGASAALCSGGGNALALDGSVTLGELLGKEDEEMLRLSGRMELQEPGFYNSERLLDQGLSELV